MTRFSCTPLWIAALLAPGFSGAAAAQFPPDTLRNIQVLDPDMNPRRIIGVMRTFAMGLNVRCEYCHVGEPGQPLSSFDFASDEKPTKEKAREMIRMVQTINTQHLAGLPDRSDPPITVGCATCHRGLAKPVTTQSEMIGAAESGGVDAALARYEELREAYYGTYSYDFSERVLRDVAESVNRSIGTEAAVRLLVRNTELFPNSLQTRVALGQAYQQLGDREAAIRELERALEISPGEAFVERLLRQVRGR